MNDFSNAWYAAVKDPKAAQARARRQAKREATVVAEEPMNNVLGPSPPAPRAAGTIKSPDEGRRSLWPARSRFVVTCAQNNTLLHENFWQSLTRFCEKTNAQLMVSRFTYNKAEWKRQGGVSKDDTNETYDSDEIWFDPRILPYVMDEQVKLAPDLVFCAELDILPTAALPLSTLTSYTGPNSGIVPHVKVHMQSIATMKNLDTKFMYTTGTVTQRNYIQRKLGQVATFHHTFGALLVEVLENGQWFVRQLISDDNGVFFDVDRAYGAGWDQPSGMLGNTTVTLGDIHIEKKDDQALLTAVDMVQTVAPSHVFVHDLVDFRARNHHNVNDPHFLAKMAAAGTDTVEGDMKAGAQFLRNLLQDTTANIFVIRSNHDDALTKWLKDDRGHMDPQNSYYWHLLNWRVLQAIRESNDTFDVFIDAVRSDLVSMGVHSDRIRFWKQDVSLLVNGIEHGMHGHLGANGAKGNPNTFRKLGQKSNTAHTHSASITDGAWVAGVLGSLDMDYNAGLGGWSHSNIVTYPNGKRCMITQRGDRWRA